MSEPRDDEDTWDEMVLGPSSGAPLEIVLVRPGCGRQQRSHAERLLAELLAVPEGERLDRLEEERFQDPSLFDLLVETGHVALPSDAQRTASLMAFASELGALLNRRGGLEPEVESEGLCRALCLAGSARRLLGDLLAADAAFERAGHVALTPEARGFFCRSLAALRWDQGRCEEVAALLHQAHRRYAEAQAFKESAVCLALLGLLQMEEGRIDTAASLFQLASRDLEHSGRPWLAAQCWLGRAFCWAASGEPDKARSARRSAWAFYGDSKGEVLLSLHWLEGRGAALAGDREDAGDLLAAVRDEMIGKRFLPEATLATIDLGLVWSAAGRGGEVAGLVEELEAVFAGSLGFDLAVGTLSAFAADAAGGQVVREIWDCVIPSLRLGFRHQGVYLRPVPFV